MVERLFYSESLEFIDLERLDHWINSINTMIRDYYYPKHE